MCILRISRLALRILHLIISRPSLWCASYLQQSNAVRPYITVTYTQYIATGIAVSNRCASSSKKQHVQHLQHLLNTFLTDALDPRCTATQLHAPHNN